MRYQGGAILIVLAIFFQWLTNFFGTGFGNTFMVDSVEVIF